MNRYQINFTDAGENESAIFKAEDFDHAEEKFWDWIERNGGSEGIQIINIILKKS